MYMVIHRNEDRYGAPWVPVFVAVCLTSHAPRFSGDLAFQEEKMAMCSIEESKWDQSHMPLGEREMKEAGKEVVTALCLTSA